MEMSAVAPVSWPCLLRAFPRLETLAYGARDPLESNGSEGGTARDIQTAFTLHSPRLKSLCVAFHSIKMVDERDEADRAFDHGLASLEELEYLITEMVSIAMPVLEDGEEQRRGDVSGIRIDALPASLRCLRILLRGFDARYRNLGQALIDLAAEVSTHLPALEKVSVVWGRIPPELGDQVMSAWDDIGVELTLSEIEWSTRIGTAGDPTRREWKLP